MKIIKSILVPTDFSDLSLAAMEYAKSFSIIFNTRIYMIHVVDNVPTLAFHTVDINSETALKNAIDKASIDLNEFMNTKFPQEHNIVLVVRRGEVYSEIIKFGQEEKIDLIVMATHGRTGLAHVFLGSVAEKVVRHSAVPVLTVKPQAMQEFFLNTKDIEEQLRLNPHCKI